MFFLRRTAFLILAVLATMRPALCEEYAVSVPTEEHVIIVVRSGSKPAATSPAAACTTVQCERSTVSTDIYDRFWHDKDQFYIDSPRGPMPLWGGDIVQDANGNPVPRYPDPFTKRLVENPDDPEAYADYLAWIQVRLRRARLTGERIGPIAAELGVITPDTLKIPEGGNTFNNAIGNTSIVERRSLGTPALSPQQAHEQGLKANEVPITPGSPNMIEVFWFWDPSCHFCDQMARDWLYFARDVGNAGYKALSITDTNDTAGGAARLNYWGVRWPMVKAANIYDWTGLMDQLKVTGTPTTVMLHRPTGRMIRFDRVASEEELRTAFNSLLGVPADQWPPTPNARAQAESDGLKFERDARAIENDAEKTNSESTPDLIQTPRHKK